MVKYLYFLLCCSSTALACEVSFSVQRSQTVSFAAFTLVVNQQTYGLDEQGHSGRIDLPAGEYTLQVYENGKQIDSQSVEVDCQIAHYPLILREKNEQLEEVVIHAQTTQQKIERTPFAVQVLDMKQVHNKGGDISSQLNRSAGIKVRSNGGLGAETQLNLGGLQGKAIRLFKDGIPIELFGHGFSLSTIPTNMLERIEIYKGAMPVYLASDALGGGVNLVTRKPKSNLVELSYEIGSFRTHRATANVFLVGKNPAYYFGMNTTYNTSANNYKIDAPFVDATTGQQYTKKVRRFHDGTSSYYGELVAGFRDKAWADDLSFTFVFADFYKEIQHDSEMGKVFGEADSSEQNYAAILSYKKGFWDDRLQVNAVLSGSHFNTKLEDTATVRYNWDNEIILSDQVVGEINKGGSQQQLHYNLLSGRINATFQVNPNHFIEFGELIYHQRRKGTDPLGAVSPVYQVDVLTIPATYQKNITALALRSLWLNDQLESMVSLKHYNSRSKGFTTDKFNFAWQSSQSNKQWGYLGGLKWDAKPILLKLSYEYATRLPDEVEVFGDGVLIKENLDLLPETSHNVNLNTAYTYGKSTHKGTVGLSLFYRRVKDAIFLQPDIPYNRYINFHQVAIKGVEVEVTHQIKEQFELGMNVTYQDIRRINERAEFKMYEGARVPNIPFFFGNAFFTSHFHGLFSSRDKVSVNWNLNYLHRFYLTDIPKKQEPSLFGKADMVDSKLIIPNDGRLGQFTQDIGVYYHFANRKINLALELLNVGNVKRYDNFNVQKPGRAVQFKIVYKII